MDKGEQPQVIAVGGFVFGRCGQVCLALCEELADCLEVIVRTLRFSVLSLHA